MEEEANRFVTAYLENLFEAQYEVKEVLRAVGEVNPAFLHARVHGAYRIAC